MSEAFPKAIVHIDGDAFFASCEIAQNEKYRGKPVVVGKEKGIAIAISYNAKDRGVSRGMLMGDIRKICPDVIVLSSHYDLYKIYSRRMYAIARRYSPVVEEYSVDECFVDISQSKEYFETVARKIKHDLEQDLGMTFSVGLASSKTLAKVASKTRKPAGFTVIPKDQAHDFLKDVPIGKVWGIGPSTSLAMSKQGIKTALDYILKPEWWVQEHFGKLCHEIWYELQGISVHTLNPEPDHEQKSVMKTRSFKPTTNRAYILSELVKNAENACAKLRKYKLVAKELSFYLKTQQFSYKGSSAVLSFRTANPVDFIRVIIDHFPKLYSATREYRATGVILRAITPEWSRQHDLFGNIQETEGTENLFRIFDRLSKKHGRRTVFLAGSLQARLRDTDDREPYERLTIPYWGEAV
jgi:DNA polymerase-4